MKPKGWYTGIVNLWNLPKKKVYIDLKEPFKSELIKTLKEVIGCKTEIGTAINESFDSIRNFFDREQTKSLEFIKKLIKVLENHNIKYFTYESIEENVKCIQAKNGKKIFNPKFPMNFNTKEGAIIVSMLFHDGGIYKTSLCPFYRNTKKELRECVEEAVDNVVGNIKPLTLMNNTLLVYPNVLGIILVHGLGLEPGPKVIFNPRIPEFIFNSGEEVKTSFLKQAFDDDGSISKGVNGSGRKVMLYSTIDVSNLDAALKKKIKEQKPVKFAPNILKGNMKLLKSLGIGINNPRISKEHTRKDGRMTYIWELAVSGRKNLIKFYEKVGFGSEDKQMGLQSTISSYKNLDIYS